MVAKMIIFATPSLNNLKFVRFQNLEETCQLFSWRKDLFRIGRCPGYSEHCYTEENPKMAILFRQLE